LRVWAEAMSTVDLFFFGLGPNDVGRQVGSESESLSLGTKLMKLLDISAEETTASEILTYSMLVRRQRQKPLTLEHILNPYKNPKNVIAKLK
jgi:hypothetical protein